MPSLDGDDRGTDLWPSSAPTRHESERVQTEMLRHPHGCKARVDSSSVLGVDLRRRVAIAPGPPDHDAYAHRSLSRSFSAHRLAPLSGRCGPRVRTSGSATMREHYAGDRQRGHAPGQGDVPLDRDRDDFDATLEHLRREGVDVPMRGAGLAFSAMRHRGAALRPGEPRSSPPRWARNARGIDAEELRGGTRSLGPTGRCLSCVVTTHDEEADERRHPCDGRRTQTVGVRWRANGAPWARTPACAGTARAPVHSLAPSCTLCRVNANGSPATGDDDGRSGAQPQDRRQQRRRRGARRVTGRTKHG